MLRLLQLSHIQLQPLLLSRPSFNTHPCIDWFHFILSRRCIFYSVPLHSPIRLSVNRVTQRCSGAISITITVSSVWHDSWLRLIFDWQYRKHLKCLFPLSVFYEYFSPLCLQVAWLWTAGLRWSDFKNHLSFDRRAIDWHCRLWIHHFSRMSCQDIYALRCFSGVLGACAYCR